MRLFLLHVAVTPGSDPDTLHVVEKHLVETTFGRMRHLVDTTFRQPRRLVDYDNCSKIRRITSKLSRNLVENWFVQKK